MSEVWTFTCQVKSEFLHRKNNWRLVSKLFHAFKHLDISEVDETQTQTRLNYSFITRSSSPTSSTTWNKDGGILSTGRSYRYRRVIGSNKYTYIVMWTKCLSKKSFFVEAIWTFKCFMVCERTIKKLNFIFKLRKRVYRPKLILDM